MHLLTSSYIQGSAGLPRLTVTVSLEISDYCVWGLMLAAYQKHMPKSSNEAELKVVLQTIWDSLSQESIDKAVLGFRIRLQACVRADGGHFEPVL